MYTGQNGERVNRGLVSVYIESKSYLKSQCTVGQKKSIWQPNDCASIRGFCNFRPRYTSAVRDRMDFWSAAGL